MGGCLVAFTALLRPIMPNDFWFHLATGRLIARTGGIPVVDTFSHTQAGAEFFNQSWLAQLAYFGLHRLGGLPAVLVAHAGLLVASYALLVWLCRRRGAGTKLGVLVVVGIVLPASVTNWGVRPQSLAIPLFAAFLVVLERYRLERCPLDAADERDSGPRGLWPLPVLMVLWVNIHGSFVVGLALLGLVLAGEAIKRGVLRRPALTWPAWRRLLGWGAVTSVAVLANPQGPAVLRYVANLVTTPAVRELIAEWAPPTVGTFAGAGFFLAAVVVLAVAVYARRRPDLTDVVVVVAFFVLGLSATRNGIWFAMVAAPFAAAQAGTRRRRPESRDPGNPALNVAVAALLLALLVVVLPWVKPHVLPPPAAGLTSADTPAAAAAALADDPQPPERLLNGLEAGSYLTWAAPAHPVFIDPRIELYPMDLIGDYFALSQAQDVTRLLATYGIDGALLSHTTERPLIRYLTEAGWTTVHEDEHFAYLRPEGGG